VYVGWWDMALESTGQKEKWTEGVLVVSRVFHENEELVVMMKRTLVPFLTFSTVGGS
jgi:hypothetical protein